MITSILAAITTPVFIYCYAQTVRIVFGTGRLGLLIFVSGILLTGFQIYSSLS